MPFRLIAIALNIGQNIAHNEDVVRDSFFVLQVRQLITPNLVLSGPIWTIDDDLASACGLRGLILDVDNTLVGDSEIELSPRVKAWIDDMRRRYPIWLISNNYSDRRIKTIATALDLPYRSRAGKPSRRILRQALEAMALPAHQVAMIGDRLFTDILAGNRLGLFTILVQPPATDPNRRVSLFSRRSLLLRDWEIWLARKTGVEI